MNTLTKVFLLGALVLAVPTFASCSGPNFSDEQQAEYDGYGTEMVANQAAFEALVAAIGTEAPRVTELAIKAWNGTLTSLEAEEFGIIIATAPSSVAVAWAQARELINDTIRLQVAREDIVEEAGGIKWLETGGAILVSLLVGMGVPTAGPLAGILQGLAPLLESLGIRNARKREEAHVLAAREGRPGYVPDVPMPSRSVPSDLTETPIPA